MSMERYALARAMGRSAYEAVVKEDEQLLAYFGYRLLSIESGITLVPECKCKSKRIHPWDTIEIPGNVWKLVHPLLQRLRSLECPDAEVLRQAAK